MQEPPITLQQYRDWCREHGIISRDCYPVKPPVYDYAGFTPDELQDEADRCGGGSRAANAKQDERIK